MYKQKATNEQILESYARNRNIWKVADEFDMCGQSVWERLKRLGWTNKNKWTTAQVMDLIATYAVESTEPININALALRIGKHKSNVSRKARELGLVTSMKRKRTDEVKIQYSSDAKKRIQKYGHPRGAYKTGKDIRVCPICGCFFEAFPSSKQRFCGRICGHNHKQPQGCQGYANVGKRQDLSGQYFRSSYEANYARYLNYLIANDLSGIVAWEYEPDTFEFKGAKQPPRFYTPDFRLLFNDTRKEYHEVKGWDHPKGLEARSRFTKDYPRLKLVLIKRDFFINIQKQGIDRSLLGWEHIK